MLLLDNNNSITTGDLVIIDTITPDVIATPIDTNINEGDITITDSSKLNLDATPILYSGDVFMTIDPMIAIDSTVIEPIAVALPIETSIDLNDTSGNLLPSVGDVNLDATPTLYDEVGGDITISSGDFDIATPILYDGAVISTNSGGDIVTTGDATIAIDPVEIDPVYDEVGGDITISSGDFDIATPILYSGTAVLTNNLGGNITIIDDATIAIDPVEIVPVLIDPIDPVVIIDPIVVIDPPILMLEDDYVADVSTTGSLTITDDGAAAITNGIIEASGDSDWFAVNLNANQSYLFNLFGNDSGQGTLVDPYLYLYDAKGTAVQFDDDGSIGLDSAMTFTAPSDGSYYIAAQAWGTATGSYTLTASTHAYTDDYAGDSSTTGQLDTPTLGNSTGVTGSIEVSGDSDWFAVNLLAGNNYNFSTLSDGSNAYLKIYDASTDTWFTNNTILPSSSGVYYVVVSSYSLASNYSITAEQYIDDYSNDITTTGHIDTLVMDAATQITGSIEVSGDSDWFAVELTAGNNYLFSSSNAKLAIFDSSMAWQATDNFIPTTTGTYYLAVSGNVGDYSVTASQYVDDFASNNSTTGHLATPSVNEPSLVSGAIDAPYGSDWFAVDLIAGDSYSFTINSPTTLYSGIYDANNNWIADATNGLFTPSATGTYYLSVSDAYGYTGNYTVTANQYADDFSADSSTTGELVIDGNANVVSSITGNIGTYDDVDWFAVNLTEGASYLFNSTGAASYVTVYSTDAFGDIVPTYYTSYDGNLFTATSTETYYLAVSSYGITGDYTVLASQYVDDYAGDASTTGQLVITDVPNTVTGNIGSYDDSDWFAVSLTAGNSYLFETSSSSYSYTNIYDTDGNFVSWNNLYAPENSGTYYVSVTGGLGNYKLTASQYVDDYADNADTAGYIETPTPDNATGASGEVIASDSDWFAVTLTAGHSYMFDEDSNVVNGVSIYDLAGSQLAFNTFTPVSTNTYYLAVEGKATGSYNLKATEYVDDYGSDNVTAGHLDTPTLETPTTVTGSIEIAGDTDRLAVDLVAGNSYTFSVNGVSFPSLVTYDATNTEIYWYDSFSVETSGTYYLDVSSYSAGDYTVTATQYFDDYGSSSATAGHLDTPTVDTTTSVTGILGVMGDIDWFAVELEAGKSYNFDDNAAIIGTHTILYTPTIYDATGSVLSWNGTITPNTTGTYYVAIDSFGGYTGEYTITASQYVDDYVNNSTTTGTIETPTLDVLTSALGVSEITTDVDWFAIQLTKGDSYVFKADNATVDVYNSSNGYEGWGGFFTAQETKTYYLAVSSYSKGDYKLTATQTDSIYYPPIVVDPPYVFYGDTVTLDSADFLTGVTNSGAMNKLYAGGGDDTVYGGDGVDTLDGGMGNDSLIGGDGGDTYVVDSTGDVVVEDATTTTAPDMVDSSIDYTLPVNVEQLTLTGVLALTGLGNGLNNVIVGNDSDNVLHGGNGNDTLDGGAGNDNLYGDKGTDQLTGGTGNDSYHVNSVKDKVIEAADGGVDKVYSSVNYTLADNIENLDLLGKKSINGTGNAQNNSLSGNNGNNVLKGMAGNDTLTGANGMDLLVGGKGKDVYNLNEKVEATDTVRIEAGDSNIKQHDIIKGFSLGFTSTSIDKLDLNGSIIAADSVSDGIDAGMIHSHSIHLGIISFDSVDNYNAPLNNDDLGFNAITAYLKSNITTAHETVAFVQHNNTYVFQDNGASNTLVQLNGVQAASLTHTGLADHGLWLV